METNQRPEAFVSLRQTAVRLGVPIAWLKTEAEAGRIPHLKTGRRLLFNPAVVERALLKSAAHRGRDGP